MKRRGETESYKPNAVPRRERVANAFLAVVLLAYGVAGLFTAHVDLSGRRIRIAVFKGGPAWLMAAALLVCAAVLLSAVVDHYDTRNNERCYRAFRRGGAVLGWWLVAAALVSHLVVGFAR